MENKEKMPVVFVGHGSPKLAAPTEEHFYPLLTALGATDISDEVTIYNEACLLGSLSMTSYLWQSSQVVLDK